MPGYISVVSKRQNGRKIIPTNTSTNMKLTIFSVFELFIAYFLSSVVFLDRLKSKINKWVIGTVDNKYKAQYKQPQNQYLL